jgi:hypothetical protein
MICITKRTANAASHVNRIPGVSIDNEGFITTKYGRYHPITGEGLNFHVPEELWNKIVMALIDDGLDSGPAVEFDIDKWLEDLSSREDADRDA